MRARHCGEVNQARYLDCASMEYRRLGATGLKVSVLSYGAWVSFSTQLGVSGAYDIMKRAFEGGVNFFDNVALILLTKLSELILLLTHVRRRNRMREVMRSALWERQFKSGLKR